MGLDHTRDDRTSVHAAKPLPEEEERRLPAGTMSESAFRRVLESHTAWLDSYGCDGRRALLDKLDLRLALSTEAFEQDPRLIALDKAQLTDADLSQRNLRGASFRGARLNGASLSHCDLRSTDFTDADLNGADLSHAIVSGATFAGADLRHANLHDVRGLRSVSLAGVDLCDARGVPLSAFAGRDTTGARLPKEVYESLAPLSDASRNARTVFQVMLGACLYCILSLSSVTDQRVIANTGRIELPILNIDIMPSWFFCGAPAILLLTFAYLLIFLRHVWEGAARLPAQFPDGTTVGDRTSPWFLTSLIERYQIAELASAASSHHATKRRAVIIQVQGLLSLVLGFWTVPATIALLGFRYLTRQSLAITAFHVVLLGIGVFLALTFHIVLKDTLREPPSADGSAHAQPRTIRGLAVLVFAILCPALIYAASTDAGREYFAPEL
ncbi:MAG TPA: pentapeptide repeat-containing protein, partial [Polyangiales bacterium]|nr:pentapeptide repeat-containing protein [Polyangiales bacterium]